VEVMAMTLGVRDGNRTIGRSGGPATFSDAKAVADHYRRSFALLLERLDLDAVDRVVTRLRLVREKGATVFLAGNGGSAATASHFANDLGKAARRSGCAPLRVFNLSDNTPWLTALANDEGYDSVFARQIENLARDGDLLIVFSASGNSTNLIRAVEVAAAQGVFSVGLLGFDGGLLKGLVDDSIWCPTALGEYGPVEDCHALLCHVMTNCLAQDRPASSNDRGVLIPHQEDRG